MPRGAGPPRTTPASRLHDRCCRSGPIGERVRDGRGAAHREPSPTDAIRVVRRAHRDGAPSPHRGSPATRPATSRSSRSGCPSRRRSALGDAPRPALRLRRPRAAGAEWIDDLGRGALRAPPRADDARRSSIGHVDWRVQNLAFDGQPGRRHLRLGLARRSASEPAIVGQAAGGFPIDWRARPPRPAADRSTRCARFVADYERARGTPFAPSRARRPRCSQPGDDRLRRPLSALGPGAPPRPRRQRRHRLASSSPRGEHCLDRIT